jgi:hypothetical protein
MTIGILMFQDLAFIPFMVFFSLQLLKLFISFGNSQKNQLGHVYFLRYSLECFFFWKKTYSAGIQPGSQAVTRVNEFIDYSFHLFFHFCFDPVWRTGFSQYFLLPVF